MTIQRRMIIIAAAAVAVAVAAAAAGFWLSHDLNTRFYNATAGEVFVDIPRGATSSTIAGLLADAGPTLSAMVVDPQGVVPA